MKFVSQSSSRVQTEACARMPDSGGFAIGPSFKDVVSFSGSEKPKPSKLRTCPSSFSRRFKWHDVEQDDDKIAFLLQHFVGILNSQIHIYFILENLFILGFSSIKMYSMGGNYDILSSSVEGVGEDFYVNEAKVWKPFFISLARGLYLLIFPERMCGLCAEAFHSMLGKRNFQEHW